MRIAVLSDVHGNLPALEAVLTDVRAGSHDLVVSAGDLVAGPQPAECLEALETLGIAVEWVSGNADRGVVEAWDGVGEAHPMDAFAATRLDRAARDRVAAWPPSVRIGGMLVCHGTPDSDEGIVTAATPRGRLARVLLGIDARLVVGGHVHHQFTLESGGTTWVNAGSVGMPYEGAPGAYWLEVVDGRPRHRRTAYDVDAALAAARAAGYPEELGVAGILRGEVTAEAAAAAFEARVDSLGDGA